MRSDPVCRIDANDLARDREALVGRRQHGDWTKYGRGRETGCPTPKLILASPPYSGIHVLFHRWQVHSVRFEPVHVAGSPEGTHLDHLSLIVEAKGIDDLEPFFTGRI
jgi:hypothetical protein